MGISLVNIINKPNVSALNVEAEAAKVKPIGQSGSETASLAPNENQVKLAKDDALELTEIMNNISKMFNSQLKFEVYEETNQLYVKFIDRDTKEVIKQIPPEELLELSAKIQKMVGLILDKYV